MLNVCNVHKMDDADKSLNNNNAHVLSLANPKVWSNFERTKISSVVNSTVQNNWTFLDEVDLVKLDDLELDEEDSWLYKSPKQKHPSSVSPYKWVREEFDSPESHFPDETLLQTLRNVTHNKGGHPTNTKTFSRARRSLLHSRVIASNSDPVAIPKDDPKTLDTRTYTKNNLTEVVSRIQRFDYHTNGAAGESRMIRRSGGEGMVDGRWLVGGDSSGGSLDDCLHDTGQHRATDVTDVKLLAKMQEDSLRQSFSTSAQRSMKSDLNKSTGHLLDNVSHGSPAHRSAHSSPGRTYGTNLTEINKSTNSLTSPSSGSNSPPDSLTNINQPLTKKSADAHKRSLPNLSKTGHLGLPPPPNLTQHPSDRDSTPSDESSDTPSTQISQPIYRSGLRRPSPKVTTPASRSPQGSPTPYKSPVASIAAAPRSGIPTPKAVSSIPRPNSASKLRAPSKIGVMRRVLTTPMQNDSSWREGCF